LSIEFVYGISLWGPLLSGFQQTARFIVLDRTYSTEIQPIDIGEYNTVIIYNKNGIYESYGSIDTIVYNL
jgi:hypothetical protein